MTDELPEFPFFYEFETGRDYEKDLQSAYHVIVNLLHNGLVYRYC